MEGCSSRSDEVVESLVEPSKIAQKKLEAIQLPDFIFFGVRFMNKAEYEETMKNGKPTIGREMCVVEGESFVDYLSSIPAWDTRIQRQTLMDHALYDYDATMYLRSIFQEARKNALKKNAVQAMRAEIMREIANILKQGGGGRGGPYNSLRLTNTATVDLKFCTLHERLQHIRRSMAVIMGQGTPKDYVQHHAGLLARRIDDISYGKSQKRETDFAELHTKIDQMPIDEDEKAELKERAVDWYDRKLAETFLSHPTNANPAMLRALMEAIIYHPRRISSQERKYGAPEASQYHIAMIYGPDAIGPYPLHFPAASANWAGIGDAYWHNDANLSAHVMGAISLIADRKLFRHMIDLNAHAGLLAHPIFDHRGRVRFPKVPAETTNS